jgi:hypothetical protein
MLITLNELLRKLEDPAYVPGTVFFCDPFSDVATRHEVNIRNHAAHGRTISVETPLPRPRFAAITELAKHGTVLI